MNPFKHIAAALLIVAAIISTYNLSARAEEIKAIKPRDYQLEIFQNSIVVYDGQRKVGTLVYSNSALDSLITNDNQ